MFQITRRLEFDAGHRVWGHEGKCANLHGHRYVAEITVETETLDQIDRVVDFSVIKERVGEWVDRFWDHNLLLNASDPLVLQLHTNPKVLGPKLPYIMKEGNPTAENMAKELFYVAANILNSDRFQVVAVRMYETPNCWADYYKVGTH